jgi:hypothetical protein
MPMFNQRPVIAPAPTLNLALGYNTNRRRQQPSLNPLLVAPYGT